MKKTNEAASSRARSILVVALLVALLPAGCGPKKMEPVDTIASGAYQIEVLAPGGTFKSGDNAVALRLLRDGQPVPFRQGLLVFSRSEADAASPLQAEARLNPGADSTGLEGRVAFGLHGTWSGQVAVVTEGGPVVGAFQVRIE